MINTPRSEIEKILAHREPSRFVYAPNYWQWFKHQKDHNLLPDEIRHCRSLLDLYNYLGVDIFSRNIYSDPEKYWFGGICNEIIDGFEIFENTTVAGENKVTNKQYRCSEGSLNEKLVYVFGESTLVQNQYLVKDYTAEYKVFRHLISNRRWIFNKEKFDSICRCVGGSGIVIAGEFSSPLKMLHLAMGPINSVYFLMEYPEPARELLELHETAQLNCIQQCVENGVRVIMSMDNLDTMFHPPDYVREYSSSFYKKASALCHAFGASFFIHACGQQKSNLNLISSYEVDGLEGVASHPLGDITYPEAMNSTPDNFIITGGISAMETRDLCTKDEIFFFVESLFNVMKPYKNRFIFSSSCNTSIDTSWETILHFRDAWIEYRGM